VVFNAPNGLKAGQKVQVELQVLDKDGNPASPEHLQVSADKGEISDLHPAPGGGFLATYTAPEEASSGVTLDAHDGLARLEGEQRFDVSVEEGEPRFLVGPSAGFTSNLGEVSTASLAAVGLVKLPSMLSAGFLVGYLPGRTANLVSQEDKSPGQVSFSRLPLHVRGGALYLAGPLEAHGGLELGPTRISGQLTALGETADLSGWHFEYGVYAGGGYKLGPGYLSVEVRGSQSKIDVTQNNLAVHGSVGGIDGAVGYLLAI
jgi:hypothetical protein